MPHLPCPAQHETLDGQRLGAHRPVRVQPGGGDADFGAESQFAAVTEARRGVDHHHGRTDRLHEALRGGLVAGGDDLGVVGAVAADVRQGVFQTVDHAYGEDKVEEYRVNGRLYMIKITPRIGLPYYLIDNHGDGTFATGGLDQGPVVRPPMWVIRQF